MKVFISSSSLGLEVVTPKMKVLLFILFGFFVTFTKGTEVADKLFDEYFQWKKNQFPIQSYTYGLDHEGTKLGDESKIGREKRLKGAEKFNKSAQKLLKSNSIESKDEFYLKMMIHETGVFIKNYGLNGQLLAAINFMEGVQSSLPQTFGDKNMLRYF